MGTRITSAEEFQDAFRVSRETCERLHIYETVLRTWQRKINLVAPSTLEDVWHRHFADSAQVLRFAPPNAKVWCDVGSGGGFPGLVLAILLAEQGDARVTLIESDTRKAAFLGEVARKTGVPVEIRADRIEKIATQAKSQAIDVITSRALAPLPRLLGLVEPLFSPRTVAIFLKGREAAAEVREAEREWQFDHRLEPSLTDAEARIAVIRNLHVRTEG
ncbi:MAG: 16S rRNA (guanine(527)-N(7))-methyltransferase RsmG [Hyphomicrobium sp.]